MCKKCHAIIDNSQPYIRGPKEIIDQFYLDIGSDGDLFPCDQRKSLPSNNKVFFNSKGSLSRFKITDF